MFADLQTKFVIDLLNEALEADPAAVKALLGLRVKANKKLAEHPTIICQQLEGENFPTIGTLGILNSALTSIQCPLVAAKIDDETGQLLEFVRYIKPNRDNR